MKFEHMREAKLVYGDARITNMPNKTEHKTEHIRGKIREEPTSLSAHPPTTAARRALATIFNKY